MTKRSMSVIAPEKDAHRLEGTTYRDRQKVALELNDRSRTGQENQIRCVSHSGNSRYRITRYSRQLPEIWEVAVNKGGTAI